MGSNDSLPWEEPRLKAIFPDGLGIRCVQQKKESIIYMYRCHCVAGGFYPCALRGSPRSGGCSFACWEPSISNSEHRAQWSAHGLLLSWFHIYLCSTRIEMSCGGLSFRQKISFFAEKLVESVLKACGLCASIRWQDDAEAGLPLLTPNPIMLPWCETPGRSSPRDP